MDKIDFARVASFFAERTGRSLSFEELRDLDALLSASVGNRVNQAAVNALLFEMSKGTSKIEAIKAYRAITNAPLKDSKDTVEAYWHPATTFRSAAE